MRISSGIAGLDHILFGGFLRGRVYLVYGEAGTGKTTLGLHFLSSGEKGLLITFAQSAEHIRADAASLGLSLNHVKILDLTPPPEVFSEVQTYDVFSPYEEEREPIGRQISKAIEELQPERIFVNSFGDFRHLAADMFHQHRLVQSFFRFATRGGATLVVASQNRACAHDADGVIQLEFSNDERSIRVSKYRGSDFRTGAHPMRLGSKGLEIPLPPEKGDPPAERKPGRTKPQEDQGEGRDAA